VLHAAETQAKQDARLAWWREARFGMFIHGGPFSLSGEENSKTRDQPTPEVRQWVRGDFDTPEQRVGKFQNDRPWESCVTITFCADGPVRPPVLGGGGWSYRPDGRTRGFEECVRMLATCATGDGKGVHLSASGLREHAARWVEKVAPWLDTQLAASAGPSPGQ